MRKALLVTAVLLALLVGAVLLGDTYVRTTAEDRAATAIQSRLALGQKPQVALEGFPFSMALLNGSVPGAKANAKSVPVAVSGKDVQLASARAETGAITFDGDNVHIATVDAIGVLSYGDLAQIAGVPVSYGGEGRLKLVYLATVGVQHVNVGITAVPVLDTATGAIRLTKVTLDPKEAPPIPVPDSELSRLARSIPIKLPGGAKLTALTPSDGGVAVGARVNDVSIVLR